MIAKIIRNVVASQKDGKLLATTLFLLNIGHQKTES